MSNKFPEWAPLSLIDLHNKYSEKLAHLSTDQKLHMEVLKRLIMDSENARLFKMKAVWSRLSKSHKTYSKEQDQKFKVYSAGIMAVNLFIATIKAIYASEQTQTTRSEDAKKYQEIAELAEKLAETLKNSRLNDRIGNLMSSQGYHTEIQGKDTDRTVFYPSNKDSFGDNSVGSSTNFPIYEEADMGYLRELLLKNKHPFEAALFHIPLAPYPKPPAISDILHSLAKDAQSIADAAKTKSRAVERPKSTSKATIFIRVLYQSYWLNEFKRPLYRTFAAFSRAALNDNDILESTVRDVLKRDFK